MARQKSIRGDFMLILRKAIEDKFTGRLVFMGKEGGVVRVTLIGGQVKQIDSTWGYGISELEKIKVWKAGLCLIKGLTDAEKERFQKMDSIDIFDNNHIEKVDERKDREESREGIPTVRASKVLPYKVLDGGPAVLDDILEDISREELSGYLKVKPHDSIMVFFEGKILGAFENLPPAPKMSFYDIIRQFHDSANQILFYNLKEEQAKAFVTLFHNRIIYSGTPSKDISLEEMLHLAKQKAITGVLWIDRERVLIRLKEGEPIFSAIIEDFWKIMPIYEGKLSEESNIYLLESLSEEELLQRSTSIIDEEELDKLTLTWLSFNRAIVDKLGKKIARGIMKKLLEDPTLSRFFVEKDGIIKPAPQSRVSAYVLMEYLLEIIERIFREAKGIIGGDWLERKIQEFYRKEKDFLDTIGLSERMKKLWMHSR